MSGLEDIYAALRKAVLDRLSAQRGGNPGSAFVAFEFGTPVPDDTFRLDDPLRTLSPELAVEFLSHLANTVPDVSNMMFRRSERTIEDQYSLLLGGATAGDSSIADLLEHVKREADNDFDNTVGSFRGPYRFRPTEATPLNWYDGSKLENWSRVKIDLVDASPPSATDHSRINPELLKWKIAPEFLKPALDRPVTSATFSELSSASVGAAIADAQHPHFELMRRHNVFLRAEPPSAEPSTRSRTRVGRRLLSTGRVGRRATRDSLEAEAVSVEEAPPALQHRKFSPLFDVHAALDLQAIVDAGAAEQPVVADSFSLDVEICLVELTRLWLSDALMTLPGWYVPGFARGSFSSGTPENTGNLAVIPTACIFIRNLTIKSNWSSADQQVIESSTNFGNFNLFGRTFDRNSMTLEVRGMQAFAWVCEPLPLMPPADPPQM